MADNLLGPRKEEDTEAVDIIVDDSKVSEERMKEETFVSKVVHRVTSSFEEAKTARLNIENQWLKNLTAYRAMDDKTMGRNGDKGEFRESEEFKPYIRTTTVKTRAAYS